MSNMKKTITVLLFTFFSGILFTACSSKRYTPISKTKYINLDDDTTLVENDSCVNCNFMGLNNKEWKEKDAPYWHRIDSAAIARNGGCFFGDLPSSMNGFTVCNNLWCKTFIYHPSIDSQIVIAEYFIQKK